MRHRRRSAPGSRATSAGGARGRVGCRRVTAGRRPRSAGLPGASRPGRRRPRSGWASVARHGRGSGPASAVTVASRWPARSGTRGRTVTVTRRPWRRDVGAGLQRRGQGVAGRGLGVAVLEEGDRAGLGGGSGLLLGGERGDGREGRDRDQRDERHQARELDGRLPGLAGHRGSWGVKLASALTRPGCTPSITAGTRQGDPDPPVAGAGDAEARLEARAGGGGGRRPRRRRLRLPLAPPPGRPSPPTTWRRPRGRAARRRRAPRRRTAAARPARPWPVRPGAPACRPPCRGPRNGTTRECHECVPNPREVAAMRVAGAWRRRTSTAAGWGWR